MSAYCEGGEPYEGYLLRVYPHNHQVYRWECCAFPNEISATRPRSEHAYGQTAEEAFANGKAEVDKQLRMGS